jgi:tetratricopeptide (TPR) repeat protein
VLVLCGARREFLEKRPTWAGPASTGFVVELHSLEAGEIARLVLGLATEPVDPLVERRIVEQAGGNPLFAEQLLALATEAPDVVLDHTPPTVEALIASRLDRLDVSELAVLRRAAVVGRRFTRAELEDVTRPEEGDRTDQDLADLMRRALLHPRQNVYVFHHVLVRDVAYRGIPKAERADLHERAARGLDRRQGAEEIVGYHFEQAHRFLHEIGRLDDRARELAAAGAERLESAGLRAWKRSDAPAAANLLSRAIDLAPNSGSICELALALNVRGERTRAMELLVDVPEPRARMERMFLQSLSEPDRAGELLELATAAIPVFESAGDNRALGRAWYCVAHVRGGFYCEYGAMEEAAERVAACYRRGGWSFSGAVDLLGLALSFGPRPVDEAIARLELTAGDCGDRDVEANANIWLGWLEAMRGNFDLARAHVEGARTAFRELGLTAGVVDSCGRALGMIESLAGSPATAARSLRDACSFLQELHNAAPVLATRAAELAAALYEQESYDEATEWLGIASQSAGEDDLDAALTRQPVEAKLRAKQGDVQEAERVARANVALAERTDALNRQADALLALAEVLDLAGSPDESRECLRQALALYERKGNLAAARLLSQRLPAVA